MNNQELEVKWLEILDTDNFFDMIIKAKEFEKEYKGSDFYKITKMPLNEVIKESKIFYALQLKDVGKRLQEMLNNLSLDKVYGLLDQMGDVFSKENADIQESLEVFKNLKN